MDSTGVDPIEAARSGSHPRVTGPSVGTGELRVPSGMSDVSRVIAGLQVAFKRCYVRALDDDPSMAGAVSFDVKVGVDGAVTGVTAKGGPGLSPDLVKCLSGVIQRARFSAPPQGQATLGVPLTFAQ